VGRPEPVAPFSCCQPSGQAGDYPIRPLTAAPVGYGCLFTLRLASVVDIGGQLLVIGMGRSKKADSASVLMVTEGLVCQLLQLDISDNGSWGSLSLAIKRREIPFSPPDITEREIEAVVEVLKSGWITTGPQTKLFEKKIAEYVGVPRAVCLNSATAAMELTLRFLGVGPGDEVITSAYTYTASASVIHHVGAKIVLVDTAADSYEMDYEQLADAITERTKVIIPVDLAGKMCDYDAIYSAVESKRHLFKPNNEIQELFNRVVVMADSAHAFGATQNGKRCGQVADFTCFSFHAVKNLTTAEGGAVVWKHMPGLDHDEIYQWFMLYSLHGQSKDALAKSQRGGWEYDIIYPAYKCNMTDILASIGLAQLERYDELLKRRKEIIQLYDSFLKPHGIETIEHYGKDFASSGHLYMLQIPNINDEQRNELIVKMAEAGVTCNVHYKPLPAFTAYKNMGFDINDFEYSLCRYQKQITLPLHTRLGYEDVMYVSENLIKKWNEIRRKYGGAISKGN
jgi:dTDP-4-amino-4,6-dideoxygalactose transaminase